MDYGPTILLIIAAITVSGVILQRIWDVRDRKFKKIAEKLDLIDALNDTVDNLSHQEAESRRMVIDLQTQNAGQQSQLNILASAVEQNTRLAKAQLGLAGAQAGQQSVLLVKLKEIMVEKAVDGPIEAQVGVIVALNDDMIKNLDTTTTYIEQIATLALGQIKLKQEATVAAVTAPTHRPIWRGRQKKEGS